MLALTGSGASIARSCRLLAPAAGAAAARPLRGAQRPRRQRTSGAVESHSRRHLMGALLGGPLLSTAGLWRGAAPAAAAAADQVAKVLEDPKWPEAWPFRPEDFLRYDESDDGAFYSVPRFVYHIDEGAVAALTDYYSEVFPPSGTSDAAVLDICSSWVSHYPAGYTAGRVTGLGMVEEELKANKQLSDWVVHDLNKDPALPFPDNTFDVITNCVSVDYLNRPLEVFREIHRVLKPGGRAVMSFSNRWAEVHHVWIVGSYFHYSVPGGFDAPTARDITPKRGPFAGAGDPMYVVTATKAAAGGGGGGADGGAAGAA
ncbi:ubiquinone menaquinone biosynthesis methyltransferase [Raphidocelis subcapitata]|uniref:Ubiquinone menaquinone biosynthesis methyltransferase n=1 Tax=Raphidocelis subcapitata TaxID=307507 RepID=A0A2V0PMQ1_9CHLO|nr:ubiquinone menaquinone biosynthesis methyltransferase [Raphidocelis subcapitata]|eukprot:GBF98355.1 ubiquinone menaquinone biosynthesis methyltransferase [Raphidocelis subcapitata]